MSGDPFVGPNERPTGTFKRQGTDGPPYVKSLTATRQPQGNKADLLAACEARDIFVPTKTTVAELRELLGPEPAWELYGRPSGFGSLIEDREGLHRWDRRLTVLGIAMDPDLLRLMGDVNPDDAEAPTENQQLDRIAARATDPDHADSKMAADRGTFVHTLCDWADEGMTGTPPWCDPRFNLTDKQIDAVAVGWRKLITDNQLDILASEATVVNDDLHLAGTLDRLVQLERPLPFDGATIPAGAVVVLDIKTSTLYPDGEGLPSFWSGYPLQLFAYATSVPYDTATDTRGDWEDAALKPSTEHALIAHLDIPRLMETGEARWQLIHVDLDVARQGVEALTAAKNYHATAKFKMSATSSTVAAPVDRRQRLLERYQLLNDAGREMFTMLGVDRNDLDAIEQALDDLDPFAQVALTGAELDQLRRTTAQLIADTAGDDRAVRRCILHTADPNATGTTELTEQQCRQLAAVCDAFGNTLGLKFSDDGPALVGDVASILAAA